MESAASPGRQQTWITQASSSKRLVTVGSMARG